MGTRASVTVITAERNDHFVVLTIARWSEVAMSAGSSALLGKPAVAYDVLISRFD